MPRNITQYRVFIGSPGGLEAERKAFRDTLHKFNKINSKHHGLMFEPTGWEDMLPSAGRPQATINEVLESCDYAVFVFHDRWGSPTGNGSKVGTEEEWEIAQGLYKSANIRHMPLYFKAVPETRMKNPDEQLKKVLAFRKRIFTDKTHLCGQFDDVAGFADQVGDLLAEWLARHLKPVDQTALATPPAPAPTATGVEISSPFTPDFAFWMANANTALAGEVRDLNAASVFIESALPLAETDDQRADALAARSAAEFYSDRLPEALATFDEIVALLANTATAADSFRLANALCNKGITLGTLDRSADAIAVYDDLIARFGTSPAPALQEQVANAKHNRAIALKQAGKPGPRTPRLPRPKI